MSRIAVRNWVRRKLQTTPAASPHDQGYLDRLPSLIQMVPLGSKISRRGSDQENISVQLIDELAKLEFRLGYRFQGYFADRSVNILGSADQRGGEPSPIHAILERLKELGDKSRQVKFVVWTDFRAEAFVRLVLFKFPPETFAPVQAFEELIRARASSKEAERIKKIASLEAVRRTAQETALQETST